MALVANYSRHFAERAIPIRHVAQTEGDRHAIERLAFERQLQGVGENCFRDAFAPGYLQHFRREIRRRDFRLRQSTLESKREIAASRREIENVTGLPAG